VSHYGVAESECLTWSIGFRAPTNEEFARAFLDFLHDRIELPGEYRDPGARRATHPGALPPRLLRHAQGVPAAIRWSTADLNEFTGLFLSEPKSHVFFERPVRALGLARFTAQGARRGLALDRRSRLLFSGSMFFMNGEAVPVDRVSARTLRRLADRRRLAGPVKAPSACWERMHTWYTEGFLHLAKEEGR
jgi:50S ribosomal protein L16 3-hydroxylase